MSTIKTSWQNIKVEKLLSKSLNVAAYTILGICAATWITIGCLRIENKIREHYEKRGYDRAIAHCNNYYWQYGDVPSQKWADKYWRYINTENGWIWER